MSKPPNIILILMDTAGAKHMSLYGYHRRTTPHLERLAEQATLYTRCFAPSSWTIPSHASLFTGLYPSEHGVDGFDDETMVLDNNYQHLLSIAKGAGYRNYIISCNALVSPIFGNCRHFDEFFDYSGIVHIPLKGNDEIDPYFKELLVRQRETDSRWRRLLYILQYVVSQKNLNILVPMILESCRRFLAMGLSQRSAPFTRRSFHTAYQQIKEHHRSYQDSPFFMFINIAENHSFYNPPKRCRCFSKRSDHNNIQPFRLYDERYKSSYLNNVASWQDLYDDTILFVDDLIGKFSVQLQSDGLLENTVFIVTSDHGEHFGEKGFYEHGFSLHNELVSIPLLISYPPGVSGGGTDDRLASLTDIFSTFLELIQSPFPSPCHSHSLLSSGKRSCVPAMNLYLANQKTDLARRLAKPGDWEVTIDFHRYALILANNLKLIWKDNAAISIFDLERDPAETHDLWDSLEPGVQEDLLRLLQADLVQNGYSEAELLADQPLPTPGPIRASRISH